MEPTSTYRADIDGLRAIAVGLVILYHFGIGPFTGGFIGVDVFFVISGYLITQILCREIEAGKFSILRFYDRRIRRIMPALLIVIVATLAIGWFTLMPGDYAELAWQSSTAALGISNFYFLWNTGYFDQVADLLPLLHTWSLAVEEQFYIFWPLLYLAIYHLFGQSRPSVVAALLGIIAVSFVLSVQTVASEPSIAFYMLHTRAWEMALGALLAFAPAIKVHALSELLATIGITAIVYAAYFLTPESSFPGLNAAAPAIGTALLIWPAERSGFVARLLSLKPFVWIGLISYSLYLWHWPVLVLFRHYANGAMPTPIEALGLIAVTFVLSFVTYKSIERPFRTWRPKAIKSVLTGAAASLAIVATGAGVVSQEGVVQRISPEAYAMRSFDVMRDFDCVRSSDISNRLCVFGEAWEASSRKVLLWGDSHARHLANILLASEASRDTTFLFFNGACAPVLSAEFRAYVHNPTRYADCAEFYDEIIGILEETPEIDTVLASAFWSTHIARMYREEPDDLTPPEQVQFARDAMARLANFLSDQNRRLIIASDVPTFERDPVSCVLANTSGLLRQPCDVSTSIPKSDYLRANDAINAAFRSLADERAVFYLPVGEALCATEICRSEIDGTFLYGDDDHLRLNLPEKVNDHLSNIFGWQALAGSTLR